MRTAVFALALVMGSSAAIAHELDGERTVSSKAIELAKDLPKTTVIRVSKKDPTKIEVVHLKEHLQPGTKISFEELAMKSETTQMDVTAANELDATSSTSSWSFGYYRGPYGGSAGYYRGPYGSAGYVRGPRGNTFAYANRYPYYRPPYYGSYNPGYYGYGYNNCYNNYGGCGYYGSAVVYKSSWAYPTYTYGGYNYNYYPYYGYSDANYDYAYCNYVY